jgi:hypothetical protein
MKIPISFLAFVFMGGIMLDDFRVSSTSAVSIIGGVLKARHSVQDDVKYPRKDCPVCKGKGWYISGDGIEKVDCGYCEPDKKEEPTEELAKESSSCECGCNKDPCDCQNREFIDDPPLVPVKPNTFILRK